MPWRGPTYDGEFPSLGWQVADWIEAHLVIPDGPDAGRPFRLTDRQLSLLVRWYAVDPVSGRRVFRRGGSIGAKGTGKSPFGGALCLAEFRGPVVFDGWDANGEPAGKRWNTPWVQLAANSEDQVGNSWNAAYSMCEQSTSLHELDIDLGVTKIIGTDRRMSYIEPVTAAAKSRSGGRITFVLPDETQLWYPERGGFDLWEMLFANVTKMGGTLFEIANAPDTSRQSVALNLLESEGSAGVLVDHRYRSVPDGLDIKDPGNRDDVMSLLEVAYFDCPWVDLDRVHADICDSAMPADFSIRYFLNVPYKGAHRAVDPALWAKAKAPRVWHDDPVLLAFDGALVNDAVALVGWTLGDVPHLFEVAVWERPAGAGDDWRHDYHAIDRTLTQAMEEFDVRLFVYDSTFRHLESYYVRWTERWGEWGDKAGGRVMEFPTGTGSRMEPAIDQFVHDLTDAAFTHQGDDATTRHVLNANLGKSQRGNWKALSKEKDSLKIDAAVAAVMGYSQIPAARLMAPDAPLVPLVGGW
jgi:hypothetical protein